MKSFCCISSKKDWQDSLQLSKRVKEMIGINISVLNSSDTTIDYDVVIYIHSKHAIADLQVLKWLKEASDLNKTFIPVIIGGNIISNKYLEFRYNGPNLRTVFIHLSNNNDRYEFMDRLASIAGLSLNGDVVGATVSLESDVKAKVYRNSEHIADLEANEPFYINLYLGEHTLDFKCASDASLSCQKKIQIDDTHGKHSISVSFYRKCDILSDMHCNVFQNGKFLGEVMANQETSYNLLCGKSIVAFECIEDSCQIIKRAINLNLNMEESIAYKIDAFFQSEVIMSSDIDCNVIQELSSKRRNVGTLCANQSKKLKLLQGQSKIYFVDSKDSNKTKIVDVNVYDTNNGIISIKFKPNFPYSLDKRTSEILNLYKQGKVFSARKIIVDSLGCTYNKAQEMIDELIGTSSYTPKPTQKEETKNKYSDNSYINMNYQKIKKLYLDGKTFAAAQYFRDAYHCSWDEAKRRLQMCFSECPSSKKPLVQPSVPSSIADLNRSQIKDLYRAGKKYAAAKFFKDQYNCTWDEAMVKLESYIRSNR